MSRSTLRLDFCAALVIVTVASLAPLLARGESCTTQDKLPPAQLTAMTESALALAGAVQAGDVAKVRAATVAEFAADFSATEYVVRNTSSKLAGDALRVTYLYGLDASTRVKGSMDSAEFACPQGNAETDFSISGLPQGNYGFVMVEAAGGARPWLLAFLLRQEAGQWKMAGFYPHARTAAGHDGLWYWTSARAQVKAGHPWSAYLYYGEADFLLRPANFVASTHLEKLRTEQHAAAPPELANGISNDAPLAMTAASGDFRFTSVLAEASEDGTRLNVMLHMRSDSVADTTAARARNAAAAAAFVNAHPDLRSTFQAVWVFAEAPGQPPFATEHPMSEIR